VQFFLGGGNLVIKNPDLRLMKHVNQVYFSSRNKIIYKICGIDSVQKIIIAAFGKLASPIYGFP